MRGEEDRVSVFIRVRDLAKRYDGADVTENAVDGIELDIAEGEFVTLLGPSGCGKTTTLRMIAGLEEPTQGEIALAGEIVYSAPRRVNIPVNKRPIGMVFQSYAIWPHMNVFENVAFPLKMKSERLARREIRERTEQALAAVGLKDLIYRPSTSLSGGQQQRVALARALVKEPKILLLDEPLSNLDAKLREQMRDEIRDLQERTGITTLFVTHDQSEALAVSDRIVVMNGGRIVEAGTPQSVYGNPADRFTADFIGVSNLLEGVASRVADGSWEVATPFGSLPGAIAPPIASGDRVVAFARPELFNLSTTNDTPHQWPGLVRKSAYQGGFTDYAIAIGEHALRVRLRDGEPLYGKGQLVYVRPDSSRIRFHRHGDRFD
jgi:iron(III) transport system ATP-binding protein